MAIRTSILAVTAKQMMARPRAADNLRLWFGCKTIYLYLALENVMSNSLNAGEKVG